jgi:hypothetical protein
MEPDQSRETTNTKQADSDKLPASPGESTPGDAHGVPVPNEDAVSGTSEEFKAVEGIRTPPDTANEQDDDSLPAAGDHHDLAQ